MSVLMAVVLLGVALFLVLDRKDAGSRKGNVDFEQKEGRKARGGTGYETENGGEKRRVKSKRVLRKWAKQQTTDSGLKYSILEEGEGEKPSPTDIVTVHYVGTLEDGTVFDSSRERNAPATFGLNQVIKGWTEGLQLMSPGGLYRFVIPPELGYGESAQGKIPANSTLTFEVELISFKAR